MYKDIVVKSYCMHACKCKSKRWILPLAFQQSTRAGCFDEKLKRQKHQTTCVVRPLDSVDVSSSRAIYSCGTTMAWMVAAWGVPFPSWRCHDGKQQRLAFPCHLLALFRCFPRKNRWSNSTSKARLCCLVVVVLILVRRRAESSFPQRVETQNEDAAPWKCCAQQGNPRRRCRLRRRVDPEYTS